MRRLSSPLRRGFVMANKLETQRSRNRRRFDQLDRDRIAEPVGQRAADEGAPGFVKAEIFIADQARRNKAVGAGLVELDEQSGAGDAGNVAVESGADAIGEEMRNE